MLRVRFSLRSFVLLAIACGAGYGLWQRWDAWTERFVLKGDGRYLNRFWLSKDERRIVTCPAPAVEKEGFKSKYSAREAWVWDAGTGNQLRIISWDAPEANGDSLWWESPNGRWLVHSEGYYEPTSSKSNYRNRLFEIETGADLFPDLPPNEISWVLNSRSSDWALIVYSTPRPPMVIHLGDISRRHDLDAMPAEGPTHAFTHDGQSIVVANSGDKKNPGFAAYDLESGKLIHQANVNWEGPLYLSSDDESLVVRAYAADRNALSAAEVWDWRQGRLLGRIETEFVGWPSFVGANRIVLRKGKEEGAILYDLKTLTKEADVTGRVQYYPGVTGDGSRFVTWDPYQPPQPPPKPGERRRLRMFGGLGDGYTFSVWGSSSGEKVLEVVGVFRTRTSKDPVIYFANNDHWLYASVRDQAWLWDATTGNSILDVDGKLAVLRDYVRYVVVNESGAVKVHCLETKEELFNLMPDAQFHESISHSQDGRMLYIADKGGDVHCFYRRRPEQWWGVAWLPEFWVALVVAPVLLWSLWRDFKTLRKAAPAEAAGAPSA